MSGQSWWVYLIECGDGSFYCGIAVDVEKRLQAHGTAKGARYVRSHGGVARLLWRYETISRSRAQSIEAWVKRQGRAAKLAIAQGNITVPEEPLPEAEGSE